MIKICVEPVCLNTFDKLVLAPLYKHHLTVSAFNQLAMQDARYPDYMVY